MQDRHQNLLMQMQRDFAQESATAAAAAASATAPSIAKDAAQDALSTTAKNSTSNANDLIYKALMNHKKAELQRMVVIRRPSQRP